MKYLIFTDTHFSYTSSIMPLSCKDSKYTTRLDMCINTLKWVFETAKEQKVDEILFAGDMFDSHTLRSEELTAISDALKFYDNEIPMRIITGNHDILDNKHNFYSSSIFENYNNISVYNKPCKINDELSVLPYMKADEIDYELLSSIKNKFLISHIDIKGSHLRPDYQMESGIDPGLLSMNFERVFNGHLHTAESIKDSSVCNIGSCTSISFSDSNSYIPSLLIFDCDSNDVKRIINPYSILFRKITIDKLSDLMKYINKIKDLKLRHILRVKLNNYDIRDDVINVIKDTDFIIAHKILINLNDSKSLIEDNIEINYDNLESEFLKFIDSEDLNLGYPKEMYNEIIKEIKEIK